MLQYLIVQVFPFILIFVLPIILIPLLMRFIISRIIFFVVRQKYLPKSLKEIHKGWSDDKDKQAIDYISKLTFKKLKYYFIFNFNLKEDVESILLCIQNIYGKEKEKNSETLHFSFSIKKLIQCLLLAFCDLHREYANQKWFKIIQNMRIIWFFRLSGLYGFYNKYSQILNIPFIEKLKRTRIIGRILRLILVPILGVPALIWYIIRSVLISIFLEGFLRFLYGLLIMKIGYYSVYLYGNNNTTITKRIKSIPKKRLRQIEKQIDKILSPQLWEKSPLYDSAAEQYIKLLLEFGINIDEKITGKQEEILEKTRRIADKIISATKTAYKKKNPFSKEFQKTADDRKKLLKMFHEISSIYHPGSRKPVLMFRIREIMETGYMACIMILNKIFVMPGAGHLLDRISLDFVLKVKTIYNKEFVKGVASGIKKSYKYTNLLAKAWRVFRVAGGIAAPYTLIFTLGSPVLFQQFQDILREFTYHRTGRLLLYGWEANKLKKKGQLTPLLWLETV